MQVIKLIFSNKLSALKGLAVTVLVIAAFAAGWFSRPISWVAPPSLGGVPIRLGGFKYINPLLFYDTPTSTEPTEYLDLKADLAKFINDNIKENKAAKISLYFRDLTKWGWININPDDKYNPASLLKVPTMIGVLKYAESHPEILSKKILYDGSFDYNKGETIKPLKQLEPGKSYSTDELLKAMIVYSDNNAAALIHDQLSPDIFYEVFTDLGLSTPPNNINQSNFDYMGPKAYASFFRVLYNSTYLSKSSSEKALVLLSGSDFPQGIDAGIPASVDTTQKFGERTVVDPNGKILAQELHDCCIVYYPNRPYLLCIMTTGSNFIDLENIISGISTIVYKRIKNL